MTSSWWKWLGVIIFIYVLTGGLSLPLNPGITEVNPAQLKPGVGQNITIKGYNTHFLSSEDTRVWMKKGDDTYLEASSVKAKDDNTMVCTWDIAADMTGYEFSILGYNKTDGTFLVPGAVFVLEDSIASRMAPASSAFQELKADQFLHPEGIRFPYRSILNETIRNTFFHVALWMAMFVLYVIGLYHAVQYLRTGNKHHDWWSAAYNQSGILFGALGLVTGSLWARYTWGGWWTNDVKLNMAALAMFIYFGYLLLRSSFNDEEKKARVSASFSIFAFVALIPLVFVIPRLTDSLHPGNGGNPALGGEDLDNTLRLFFYPSIIALILLGAWMAQLQYRISRLASVKNIPLND